MLAKYPDRVPVHVERARWSELAVLDRRKFLVPGYLTVGQFVHAIRTRLRVDAQTSVFVFFGNRLMPTSATMARVFAVGAEADGILYATYAGEATFGAG